MAAKKKHKKAPTKTKKTHLKKTKKAQQRVTKKVQPKVAQRALPKTIKKDMPKITKHMMLADVVQRYPQTAEVFMWYGLHCFGCHVAMFETIEQGAMAHMINVDELVKALNDAVSK